MPSNVIQFFTYSHLADGRLREVSKMVSDLAVKLEEELPDGAEKSAGMRKLLEAKDCFVRSVINLPKENK